MTCISVVSALDGIPSVGVSGIGDIMDVIMDVLETSHNAIYNRGYSRNQHVTLQAHLHRQQQSHNLVVMPLGYECCYLH
jgi:hypothetical protein